MSTCSIGTRSAKTFFNAGSSCRSSVTPRRTRSVRTNCRTACTISFSDSGCRCGAPRFSIPRRRRITCPARSSASTMSRRIARTSSRSGLGRSSISCAASALLMMIASGWFSSCARAPDSSLSVATRDRCSSSTRCRAVSSSARLRSVMSIVAPISVGAPRGSSCAAPRAPYQRVSPDGSTTRYSTVAPRWTSPCDPPMNSRTRSRSSGCTGASTSSTWCSRSAASPNIDSACGVAHRRPVARSTLHRPARAASAANASFCSDPCRAIVLASSSAARRTDRIRSRLRSKPMNSTIGRKNRLARTGSRASPQYESTAEPKAADTKTTMLAPTVSARRRWPCRHAGHRRIADVHDQRDQRQLRDRQQRVGRPLAPRQALAQHRDVLEAGQFPIVEVGGGEEVDDERHAAQPDRGPSQPRPPGSQMQANEEDGSDQTSPDRKVIPPEPAAELRRDRSREPSAARRTPARPTLAASSAKAPFAVTLRSRSHTWAWIAASVRHAAAMTSSAAVNQPIVPLARRVRRRVNRTLAPGERDYAGLAPPLAATVTRSGAAAARDLPARDRPAAPARRCR